MKVVTAVTCTLAVILGLGCYTVVHKIQETEYKCIVLTHGVNGKHTYRYGVYTQGHLESIVENGGGMLGVHVSMMQKNHTGSYVSPIMEQEDVVGGAVVCKKSVTL